MTNDEINKYIHVEIMRKREKKPDSCPICSVVHDDARQRFENAGGDYPDYCSDNSPRSLLNEVVAKLVKKVGDLYFGMLEIELYRTWRERGRPKHKLDHLTDVVQATAEQIARACVEAHKASCQHTP